MSENDVGDKKYGVLAVEADGSIESTARAFVELGEHICPSPLHAVDSLIFAAAALASQTLALGKESDEVIANVKEKMQGLVVEVFDQNMERTKSRDDYEKLSAGYLESCAKANEAHRKSLN